MDPAGIESAPHYAYFSSLLQALLGSFLAVQWLRLGAFTAGGLGSDSGWGTEIPQVVQHGQKKKKKNQFLPHL